MLTKKISHNINWRCIIFSCFTGLKRPLQYRRSCSWQRNWGFERRDIIILLSKTQNFVQLSLIFGWPQIIYWLAYEAHVHVCSYLEDWYYIWCKFHLFWNEKLIWLTMNSIWLNQIHPKSQLFFSWIFQKNVTNWTIACCTNALNGKGRLWVLSDYESSLHVRGPASTCRLRLIKSNLSFSLSVFSCILRWACEWTWTRTNDTQHDITKGKKNGSHTRLSFAQKGLSTFLFFRVSTN